MKTMQTWKVSRKILQALTVGASLAGSALALAEEPPQLDLPWPVQLENKATEFRVTSPDSLLLVAPPKTDTYISSDGKYRPNASPRVLFRPEGPFILTSKITLAHNAMWDAGALMIYNDPEHFVKFCYERDFKGVTRVVSVVCNGVGDDCNSDPVPGGEIYFRITGAVPGDTFSLYFSRDGKSWSLVRGFRLEKTDALRVGFSAQSPVGEGCSVKFSEIKLERRAPKDWWTGE